MKNIKNCILMIFMFGSFIFSIDVYSKEKLIKWILISGKWETQKLGDNKYFIIETTAKAIAYNYHELINFNSIILDKPLPQFNRINYFIDAFDPIDSAKELLLFFASNDYREFVGYKLSGTTDKGYTSIALIQAQIKDPSLPRSVKSNYTLTDLANKEISLPFGKKHKVEITFVKNTVTIAINGKPVLSHETDKNYGFGKIGFGTKNTKLKVFDVKVYSGNRIVFQDDFREDTVKRYTAKFERVKKEK